MELEMYSLDDQHAGKGTTAVESEPTSASSEPVYYTVQIITFLQTCFWRLKQNNLLLSIRALDARFSQSS
jgi:hypothetical protein